MPPPITDANGSSPHKRKAELAPPSREARPPKQQKQRQSATAEAPACSLASWCFISGPGCSASQGSEGSADTQDSASSGSTAAAAAAAPVPPPPPQPQPEAEAAAAPDGSVTSPSATVLAPAFSFGLRDALLPDGLSLLAWECVIGLEEQEQRDAAPGQPQA